MEFLQAPYKLILASKSPRRQQLLRELGFDFEVRTQEVDESHGEELNGVEIAEYLASKKAQAFRSQLGEHEIVLSSDTVVWCNNESLAKAQDRDEAITMLTKLSGRSHEVITGVCMLSREKEVTQSSVTKVIFADLNQEEIEYYVDRYTPFDKAGAYGIQEWIGMWAIKSIEGSYFNVVGLPTHLIYPMLKNFIGA